MYTTETIFFILVRNQLQFIKKKFGVFFFFFFSNIYCFVLFFHRHSSFYVASICYCPGGYILGCLLVKNHLIFLFSENEI